MGVGLKLIKMAGQKEQPREQISFEYWTKPRERFLRKMAGEGDGKEPQYLETKLLKDVIKLLFPDVAKEELEITPDLETIANGYVTKPITAQYKGPREDYIRTIAIRLTDDKGRYKIYDIEVTSTPEAIEIATTTLQSAVYDGILKHQGRLARKRVKSGNSQETPSLATMKVYRVPPVDKSHSPYGSPKTRPAT